MSLTKKDLLGEGSNRYCKIRQRARIVINKLHKNPKCSVCGYAKHVEVCHIKPIKEFKLDALIDDINNPSNLLILCPNCHWEHDNINKKENQCSCGKRIYKYATHCRNCVPHARKVPKVPKEELIELIKNFSMVKLGKRFGVSDNAVRKWCKSYGINWK